MREMVLLCTPQDVNKSSKGPNVNIGTLGMGKEAEDQFNH